MKKQRTIMVIDDDNTMVKILEKQLANAGHRIIGNLSGEGAFKRLKLEIPDLILLDLMFDDTNGVEIAKKLKADPQTKDIPIIFITATMGVEQDKGDETIDIDGDEHRIFAKPLHIPKLIATIRKTLNYLEQTKKKDE